MNRDADLGIAEMQGAAALPRDNGELVFEAPWEGRAFGVAVTLVQQGVFDWHDFQIRLVAQIERVENTGGPYAYYERWLAALERVAVDKGLITARELDERTDRYASTG
jgi:nitrile hydratase accessory protein